LAAAHHVLQKIRETNAGTWLKLACFWQYVERTMNSIDLAAHFISPSPGTAYRMQFNVSVDVPG
jgi:hypothetical protein